jgi:hypothetical protein
MRSVVIICKASFFLFFLQNIGELTVSVSETVRGGEICYYVHAQSHGVIDNVPMGTSVTGMCTE